MLTPEIIAKMLDHSTLQPWLTEADIRRGCEIALRYKTADLVFAIADNCKSYHITTTAYGCGTRRKTCNAHRYTNRRRRYRKR